MLDANNNNLNNNDNEDDDQYQESSNPKITIMLDMLSKERQTEINNMLVDNIRRFEQSGKLEKDKIYPLELTHGFDQEEPKQYIYIFCAFRIKQLETPIVINKNLPSATSTLDMSIQDIEVFKEDSMFDWLDHVNRINKNSENNKDNQLFYEDNIFTKKDNNNKQDEKEQDDKKNPNQCNINKPVHGSEMNADSVMIGSVSLADNSPENNEYENYIPHGITKEELFDFYNEYEPEKTKDEYLSLFSNFARNVVNGTMMMYYSHKLDDDNHEIVAPIHGLKNLQVTFCKCDFWMFNKKELGQLGFINWSDELLLIPVWAFPVILNNSKNKIVYSPSFSETLVGEIDVNEKPYIKYGCVPYGLKISELNKS